MAIADPVQAPPVPPDGGGDGGAKKKDDETSPIQTTIGLAVLFLGVVVVSQAIIRKFGWTTPVSVWLSVASAGLTTGIGYLVANRSRLKKVRTWAVIVAVIMVGVTVYFAYRYKEAVDSWDGEITREHPVGEHQFKADAGEYALILTSNDGLKGQLKLSYGRFDLSGTSLEDGRVMIRDILTDGTWSAEIQGVDGSNGHYRLKKISDDADDLGVEDARDDEILAEPTFSNSYVLELSKRQKIYLRVAPSAGSTAPVELRVMKPNGFEVAIPRREGNNLVVFRTLPADTYIISVRSTSYEAGEYGLVVSRNAPAGTPTQPTVPTGTVVPVPDVVGFPQQSAVDALTVAGFAPRAFDVCSGSVGAGEVREIRAVENGNEKIVVGLDGVTDAGQQLEAGTNLIVKVGTGEACE